jgi:hypothetical protein
MAAVASSGSELDALVAAEAQLDRRIAEARARATELRETARRRAAEDELALEAELVAERARIGRDAEAAADAAVRAIDEEAHTAIARYQSLTGECLAAIAVRLAARLVALAASSEEVAP